MTSRHCSSSTKVSTNNSYPSVFWTGSTGWGSKSQESLTLIGHLSFRITGIETKPIIDSAGTDITHWFDGDSRDVSLPTALIRRHCTAEKNSTQKKIPHTALRFQLRKRTTDDTLVELAYTPLGPVLHVPPSEPRSDWANDFGTPWWKDRSLWIAKLSQKQRQIRVVNTLTHQEDLMEVM